MRDIYGQSVNMVFYLGESGAGPIQPLRPAISAPPVILQSTLEAVNLPFGWLLRHGLPLPENHLFRSLHLMQINVSRRHF